MTYTGGASDVITLAHELGHAYHSWVMRDLPDCQRRYGMSLAETASTFGEAIVRDDLLARAGSPAEELAIVWEEASALVAFILNIPARFDFEKGFCEARAERPLRPAELNEMMSAAWKKWYGDCLAEPDPLFWASKLHFYISGLSFYNFPYLFGYLFSLGVYARRDELGDEFFPRYEALLRDTGRMTAEDLAAKHLGRRPHPARLLARHGGDARDAHRPPRGSWSSRSPPDHARAASSSARTSLKSSFKPLLRPGGRQPADRNIFSFVLRHGLPGQGPCLDRERPHHRKPLFRRGRRAQVVPGIIFQSELAHRPLPSRAGSG